MAIDRCRITIIIMPTITRTTLTLTQLLSHLIRLPTITGDQPACRSALDWIETQLAGLPLTIKRFNNHGFGSLIATTSGTTDEKNPRLWLAGHLDVIPGTVVDFEPSIKDGRLIGRGAFDMKYAIACFIRLAQELGDDLANYDLGIMITTDEELSGAYGTRWLLDNQGYRGGAVLLPECGTSWSIETGAKGVMRWQITSYGKASHGSRPWNGVNAIELFMRFLNQLKTNVPAEPCGDEQHQHATINLGQLDGGRIANQVPDRATAMIDVRLSPGISLAEASSWFSAAARAVPGVNAHMLAGNAATTNIAGQPVALFTNIVRAETGRDLVPMISHGASDGRYFQAHGIAVISVPPTGGGQHSAHEWVDLASLNQYYAITRRFAREWAGPKRPV
jgi:succinyl-diaminopimelate desuccinylase